MTEAVDYFSNHRLKLRFPWSLYHDPIVEALSRAIRDSPGPDVLNVGSGPFFELERLSSERRRFTVCDIDPRAIAIARELHGSRLAGADVVEPGAHLPYESGTFDLVVSMDVIEHLPDPAPWLAELVRVTRPGGALFLTTPNYASCSLKIIERTVLEAIARLQGFSRKHLHPTPLDPLRMQSLLRDAGAAAIQTRITSLGWVVCASARRPHRE